MVKIVTCIALVAGLLCFSDSQGKAESAYCSKLRRNYESRLHDLKPPEGWKRVLACNPAVCAASCTDFDVFSTFNKETAAARRKWLFDCNAKYTAVDGTVIDKSNVDNLDDSLADYASKQKDEKCNTKPPQSAQRAQDPEGSEVLVDVGIEMLRVGYICEKLYGSEGALDLAKRKVFLTWEIALLAQAYERTEAAAKAVSTKVDDTITPPAGVENAETCEDHTRDLGVKFDAVAAPFIAKNEGYVRRRKEIEDRVCAEDPALCD